MYTRLYNKAQPNGMYLQKCLACLVRCLLGCGGLRCELVATECCAVPPNITSLSITWWFHPLAHLVVSPTSQKPGASSENKQYYPSNLLHLVRWSCHLAVILPPLFNLVHPCSTLLNQRDPMSLFVTFCEVALSFGSDYTTRTHPQPACVACFQTGGNTVPAFLLISEPLGTLSACSDRQF